MGTTITRTTTFVIIDCPNCGSLFGITTELDHRRGEDGKQFWCPLGHSMSYHETEVMRLRKRAERLERTLANKDEDLRSAYASLTATKGALTKARRRADRGVCQHCHRSFVNVQRHVKSQHPGAMES